MSNYWRAVVGRVKGTFVTTVYSEPELVKEMMLLEGSQSRNVAMETFNAITSSQEALRRHWQVRCPGHDQHISHLTQQSSVDFQHNHLIVPVQPRPSTTQTSPGTQHATPTMPAAPTTSRKHICRTCGHMYAKTYEAYKCHFMSTERNHPKNVDHDNCYCQSEYYVKYEPNRTNSFKESVRHPPNIDNMPKEQID